MTRSCYMHVCSLIPPIVMFWVNFWIQLHCTQVSTLGPIKTSGRLINSCSVQTFMISLCIIHRFKILHFILDGHIALGTSYSALATPHAGKVKDIASQDYVCYGMQLNSHVLYKRPLSNNYCHCHCSVLHIIHVCRGLWKVTYNCRWSVLVFFGSSDMTV